MLTSVYTRVHTNRYQNRLCTQSHTRVWWQNPCEKQAQIRILHYVSGCQQNLNRLLTKLRLGCAIICKQISGWYIIALYRIRNDKVSQHPTRRWSRFENPPKTFTLILIDEVQSWKNNNFIYKSFTLVSFLVW